MLKNPSKTLKHTQKSNIGDELKKRREREKEMLITFHFVSKKIFSNDFCLAHCKNAAVTFQCRTRFFANIVSALFEIWTKTVHYIATAQ